MMALQDCLGAAEECNAPMVSICGANRLSIRISNRWSTECSSKDASLYLHQRHVYAQKMRDMVARN